MPYCGQYRLCGAAVAVWRVTETPEELSQFVAAEYAAEWRSRFGCNERCCEWLAVRALLKMILGDDARIVYDAAGKPLVDGGGVYISVSHTRGYAVLAVSRDAEVGVDVELLSRNALQAAGRFMEASALEGLAFDEASRVALFHWCAKEALYKVVGDLGGNFKENISVGAVVSPPGGSFCVSVTGLGDGADADFAAECVYDNDVLLVLCSR